MGACASSLKGDKAIPAPPPPPQKEDKVVKDAVVEEAKKEEGGAQATAAAADDITNKNRSLGKSEEGKDSEDAPAKAEVEKAPETTEKKKTYAEKLVENTDVKLVTPKETKLEEIKQNSEGTSADHKKTYAEKLVENTDIKLVTPEEEIKANSVGTSDHKKTYAEKLVENTDIKLVTPEETKLQEIKKMEPMTN